VAQFGSVSVWGTEGRWFKSSRPDHNFMKKKFRIFYSTCANIKDGKMIAKFLLKNNMALCVNLIKNIDSFYLEKNKIQSETEVAILIKTCCTKNQIEKFIKKIHKYDVPLIVELKTGLPNKDYLDWFFKI
jgi:periplasmic divalent cation tolerance protein